MLSSPILSTQTRHLTYFMVVMMMMLIIIILIIIIKIIVITIFGDVAPTVAFIFQVPAAEWAGALQWCWGAEEGPRETTQADTCHSAETPPDYIPCRFKQVQVLAHGERAQKLICQEKYFMPEKVSNSQQLHKYAWCVQWSTSCQHSCWCVSAVLFRQTVLF